MNFRELKKEFAPLELFDNLSLFSEFSKVHCLRYPVMLKKGGAYNKPAEYFDKRFWQDLLEQSGSISDANSDAFSILKLQILNVFSRKHTDDLLIPAIKYAQSYCDNTAPESDDNEYIGGIRKWIADNGESDVLLSEDADVLEITEKEIVEQEKLWIDYIVNKEFEKEPKKLPYLAETGFYDSVERLLNEYNEIEESIKKSIGFIGEKVCNGKENGRKALVLTAICELAEVDALTANWTTASESSEKVSEIITEAQPTDFTYENSVPLFCGSTPYKFWQYESDRLEGNEKIRTVRIDARKNKNNKKAVIEIIDRKTNKCAQKIVVNSGDSVYVSVAGNSVIKALPEYSAYHDNCVIKRSDSIWVYQKGREAWTTSVKDVTSIASGSASEGFILVSGGRIITDYSDGFESNYSAKLVINAIISPVIEVKKASLGFDILLNDGTVVNTHGAAKRSAVTLSSIDEDTLNSRSELLNNSDFGEDVKYALSRIKDKFLL